MNRIHVQLYGDFIISGTHYVDIMKGQTRRLVFPDSYNIGVTGKIKFNGDNDSSSLVLNTDEIQPNYFFISIVRRHLLLANIDYGGDAKLRINNQFIIDENTLNMPFAKSSLLKNSNQMEIDIGSGEFNRIDLRMNEGSYFSVSFGARGIIMVRANGNTGIPIFQNMVRSEATTQIVQRSEKITREFLFRYLIENQNLPQDAEGLFAAICSITGIDRFIR